MRPPELKLTFKSHKRDVAPSTGNEPCKVRERETPKTHDRVGAGHNDSTKTNPEHGL